MSSPETRRSARLAVAVAVSCTVLFIGGAGARGATPEATSQTAGLVDGTLGGVEACDDFFVGSPLFGILGTLPLFHYIFGDHDVPDPAWVLVGRRDASFPKFRSATGVIAESPLIGDYPERPLGDEAVVNFKDFPDVHDTHDMNFYLRLDDSAENDGIISSFGIDSQGRKPGEMGYLPDTLEVEWETGILNSARTGDGRFFPKSMWPVAGDRVWVNGYWIFDCGHTVKNEVTDEEGIRSEIHPPRAIATMRRQVATPPDSSAPIPVTAVDLYIHGRAGVVVDLLECGGRVIVGNRTCPTRTGETPSGSDTDDGTPGHDIALDHLGMPIAEDFEFTVCAPPKPSDLSPDAEPRVWVEDAPGVQPQLTIQPADGACATGEFGPKQVRVKVELSGTGLTPDDVYARHLYVGWVGAPVKMRRLKVTLDTMRLNDDLDHDGLTPGDDDCECSWFWMSVDRSPDEWLRLSDHADDPDHHMNDFREGTSKTFTDATWELSVPDGQPFTFRAFGYDGGVGEGAWDPFQDCFDDHFGHHNLAAHANLDLDVFPPGVSIPDFCYLGASILGEGSAIDDPFDIVRREVTSGDLDGLFGAWPGSGSASMDLVSMPLRCRVTHSLPFGGVTSSRVVCESAAQAREAFEDNGFTVLDVDAYHQVELAVTLESLPVDSDGDGILDADEISGGTDPLDSDSDDDGLTDGDEVNTHGTDPNDSDSDDDGLSDGDEVNVHHTDPLDADSDDDELPDGLEVAYGTDPLVRDSDADGIIDGEDVEWLQAALGGVAAGAFNDSGGGLLNAMLTQLDAVEHQIASGRVRQAIRTLRSLRTRVDGCGAAADHSDWIVDCPAQQQIRDLIDLLIANLE